MTHNNSTILKNACSECGGDITVKWGNKSSKSLALMTDVCPSCFDKGRNDGTVHIFLGQLVGMLQSKFALLTPNQKKYFVKELIRWLKMQIKDKQ